MNFSLAFMHIYFPIFCLCIFCAFGCFAVAFFSVSAYFTHIILLRKLSSMHVPYYIGLLFLFFIIWPYSNMCMLSLEAHMHVSQMIKTRLNALSHFIYLIGIAYYCNRFDSLTVNVKCCINGKNKANAKWHWNMFVVCIFLPRWSINQLQIKIHFNQKKTSHLGIRLQSIAFNAFGINLCLQCSKCTEIVSVFRGTIIHGGENDWTTTNSINNNNEIAPSITCVCENFIFDVTWLWFSIW